MYETERSTWQDVSWPRWIRQPPIILDTVDSTNRCAASLAREQAAPEGILVVAEEQTAGRGRRHRTWYSPRERSICASVILRPGFEARFAQLPTLLASAAAAAAIQHLYQLPARVKWPNDVQITDKKVGGILTESVLSGQRIEFLVVGIGLNCNVLGEEWPPEIRQIATSIKAQLGRPVDRGELLALVLAILGRDYAACREGDYAAAMRGWRSLNTTLGREVTLRVPGGTVEGFAEELLVDGTLRLRESKTGGLFDVRMGEIA